MNWKQFKETKYDLSGLMPGKGRFDNVDLGAGNSMQRMIAQTKKKAADTLQELIDSKELDPNITVANAIMFLRGV